VGEKEEEDLRRFSLQIRNKKKKLKREEDVTCFWHMRATSSGQWKKMKRNKKK